VKHRDDLTAEPGNGFGFIKGKYACVLSRGVTAEQGVRGEPFLDLPVLERKEWPI